MESGVRNTGVTVVLAGTGINLALGVLYSWSIFKGAIRESIQDKAAGGFTWSLESVNDPYALCCLVFAFGMILAGRFQDRFGPRFTAMLGGFLVGAGFFWISHSRDYGDWLLGFGGLAGLGIAFGYSSATPPAIKWYAPQKTGLIAGIVVAGFGLASVYIAPLSQYLVAEMGLDRAMTILGAGFFIVVTALAALLRNPPQGYVPPQEKSRRKSSGVNAEIRKRFREPDLPAARFIKTPTFWAYWVLYFVGAGAGLMVIGSIAQMAKASLGAQAFLAVALMAIGNAGGRVFSGIVSDRLGRIRTLTLVLFLQAAAMLAAVPATGRGGESPLFLVLVATLIGFNYGSNLTLFPTLAKESAGMKNFGVNYGFLFTAWGVGGFVLSRVSEILTARSGSYRTSLLLAAGLLAAAGVFSLFVKDQKSLQIKRLRAEVEREQALMAGQAASTR